MDGQLALQALLYIVGIVLAVLAARPTGTRYNLLTLALACVAGGLLTPILAALLA